MEAVKRWFSTSSPLVKTLMAVSVTSGLVVVHRLFYAPHVQRKRYRQAEEWANMIIEQEEAAEAARLSEQRNSY
ncbi:uncharacterized protein LOC125225717 [Leguminivora glycinivorella]|uniref:uncharacterized protein LOC125225717 n=1 Tax=Leguminivora glycinivorella TaxID=1035111 RepID=UPI002010260F|nr:uncharacterized protein LOC125225717 [Leguminivora glycinivorella]